MATRGDIASERVDPVFAWAELESQARLVIHDDLRVVWCNGAALRIMQDTNLFSWCQNRIGLKDGRCMNIFRSFIRMSGVKASTLCLPHPSDDHVLCTALAIGAEGPEHVTGLTLRRAGRCVSLDGAALESAFHLTTAERRVVETLFAGRTAEEAGARLSVSVGTIRAHIRHIYEKVNVGSREAMFHKLLPYMSAW